MEWIRHIVLDLVITVIVVIAAASGPAWALWVVWIYTPLLLLLKLAALFAPAPRMAQPVPDLVYHVLYATSFVALLFAEQVPAAAGWAGIWLLSALQSRRLKKA